MTYIEALRLADRLKQCGWKVDIQRLPGLFPRWYVRAGSVVRPLWLLKSESAGAKLLMAIEREGWYGPPRVA